MSALFEKVENGEVLSQSTGLGLGSEYENRGKNPRAGARILLGRIHDDKI